MPAPCGHQGLILFQESQARREGRVNHLFCSFDDKKLQRQPSVFHALGWKAERKHVRVTRWVGSVLAVESCLHTSNELLSGRLRGTLRAGPVVGPALCRLLLIPGRRPVADSSRQAWWVLTESRQPPSLVPGDSAPGGGRFFLADPALGKLDQKITIQAVPKPELHALDKPSSVL